jgi:hypothetical protein
MAFYPALRFTSGIILFSLVIFLLTLVPDAYHETEAKPFILLTILIIVMSVDTFECLSEK